MSQGYFLGRFKYLPNYLFTYLAWGCLLVLNIDQQNTKVNKIPINP